MGVVLEFKRPASKAVVVPASSDLTPWCFPLLYMRQAVLGIDGFCMETDDEYAARIARLES